MTDLSSNKPTFFGVNPQIQLNYQGKILLMPLTASRHLLGRDPHLPPPEGFKVPDDWSVMSRCQACIRKVGNDYYIYDGDGERPSTNRLFVEHRIITPKDGYKLRNNAEITVGQNPQNWVILIYIEPNSTLSGTAPKQQSVSLKNKIVVLGRSANADLELDSPTVSRRHATVESDDRGRYILRDYSTNGVFVNRQRVNTSAILAPGDLIQIGPYTFVLQDDELVLVNRGDNIRLQAKNIVKIVRNKERQPLRLLNDLSVAIEPGQFAALVGGSGAGKSTFMKALLGIEPITEGTVYLNGDNLKKNFNIYRTLIGYVPQYDIIHTHLKVKEVLYYAAKLRLPPDINIEQVVQRTLEQIELVERQDNLVKNLSGGQLKRVSIGVELLADPKLFFLDEPTSGLDPGLDKKMMELLRKLANEGRTIILVTHATANITLCDRLVFLGLGGNLCYFGPPDKAIEFFQIDSGNFADIYVKLESKEAVAEESDRFRHSEYYEEYVNARLSEVEREVHSDSKQVKRSFLQQLSILTQRYLKLLLRDPVNLALSLLTAPLGIALIAIAVQNKIPLVGSPEFDRAALARKVLFVFTCAAIWVGLASSLQEIVKESAIYLRERLVNLRLFSYLGSKILTLGGMALIQSFLISLVVFLCFKSPDPKLILNYDSPQPTLIPIPWSIGVFITTFLTLLTSISLGLMVSASVKNSTQASSSLPLLLLPQIIFAGVLFDMTAIGKYISWLMLSRWSVGAYGILADVNNLVPLLKSETEENPIKALPMFEATIGNLATNWGVLLLHTVIYLIITFWLQKRKDIFN